MNSLMPHIGAKPLSSIDETEHGYWSLRFGDSYLAVYNPMEVLPREKAADLDSLRGLVVQDVIETEDSMTIELDGGITFQIDLRPESNVGPEAMLLHAPKNVMIVW